VTQAAAPSARPAILPYALGSAAFCALSFAAASFVADRHAAILGAGAAAAGALCALPAIAVGAAHGTNGVLGGFLAGFFARMIAIAVGLAFFGVRGDSALVYALAFFALYVPTQAVEVAYVWGSSRTRRAGA
jgi:hypothetical protein